MSENRESLSYNPFRGIAEELTPEKAAVMAARRYQRQAKAAPLFAAAGLLETCSADDIINASRRHAEAWERLDRKLIRLARLARHFVSRRVTAKELIVLDGRRAKLPKSPAYSARLLATGTGGLMRERRDISEVRRRVSAMNCFHEGWVGVSNVADAGSRQVNRMPCGTAECIVLKGKPK